MNEAVVSGYLVLVLFGISCVGLVVTGLDCVGYMSDRISKWSLKIGLLAWVVSYPHLLTAYTRLPEVSFVSSSVYMGVFSVGYALLLSGLALVTWFLLAIGCIGIIMSITGKSLKENGVGDEYGDKYARRILEDE